MAMGSGEALVCVVVDPELLDSFTRGLIQPVCMQRCGRVEARDWAPRKKQGSAVQGGR